MKKGILLLFLFGFGSVYSQSEEENIPFRNSLSFGLTVGEPMSLFIEKSLPYNLAIGISAGLDGFFLNKFTSEIINDYSMQRWLYKLDYTISSYDVIFHFSQYLAFRVNLSKDKWYFSFKTGLEEQLLTGCQYYEILYHTEFNESIFRDTRKFESKSFLNFGLMAQAGIHVHSSDKRWTLMAELGISYFTMDKLIHKEMGNAIYLRYIYPRFQLAVKYNLIFKKKIPLYESL